MMGRVAAPGRMAVQLLLAHARVFVRDRASTIAVLVSFVGLLALLGGIDVIVTDAAGSSPGILRGSLGLVATTGFMAVALSLTTVPLTVDRARGVFHHLSATPVRPALFLITHVPIRVCLIFGETGVLLAVSHRNAETIAHVLQRALTLLLGGALLLAAGYLLAARLANPDVARPLAFLLPVLVLTTSGALFPLTIYPDGVAAVCAAMPTTWFVDALSAQIAGTEPRLPLGVTWMLLALLAVVCFCAAVRCFRWHR